MNSTSQYDNKNKRKIDNLIIPILVKHGWWDEDKNEPYPPTADWFIKKEVVKEHKRIEPIEYEYYFSDLGKINFVRLFLNVY